MKPLTIGSALALLLCAGATHVEAQAVASSFDQLTVLVKPGDKIRVIDINGVEAEGRIGTLSRDALILATDAGLRKLLEADVARISQRRGDSLKNGAIIGAVGGAAYGLTMLALSMSIDDGDVIPATVVTGMVLFTGIGAAVGVGIDAMIAPRQVIYERPVAKGRVSVSPLVGHGRRGAAVSIRF